MIIINRIIVLQAENEHDMQEWIDAIRTANQAALNSDKAPTKSLQASSIQKNVNIHMINIQIIYSFILNFIYFFLCRINLFQKKPKIMMIHVNY